MAAGNARYNPYYSTSSLNYRKIPIKHQMERENSTERRWADLWLYDNLLDIYYIFFSLSQNISLVFLYIILRDL